MLALASGGRETRLVRADRVRAVLSVTAPIDEHGTYDLMIRGAGSPMSVPSRVAPPSR